MTMFTTKAISKGDGESSRIGAARRVLEKWSPEFEAIPGVNGVGVTWRGQQASFVLRVGTLQHYQILSQQLKDRVLPDAVEGLPIVIELASATLAAGQGTSAGDNVDP